MSCHTPISINDDLATGKPGVAHGTSDNKAPGRIDMVFGLVGKPSVGQNGCDYLFLHVALNLFEWNIFIVLC